MHSSLVLSFSCFQSFNSIALSFCVPCLALLWLPLFAIKKKKKIFLFIFGRSYCKEANKQMHIIILKSLFILS